MYLLEIFVNMTNILHIFCLNPEWDAYRIRDIEEKIYIIVLQTAFLVLMYVNWQQSVLIKIIFAYSLYDNTCKNFIYWKLIDILFAYM